MSYRGDGLSTDLTTAAGYVMSVEQRSQAFELPSLVNIGGAYDFYLTKDSSGVKKITELLQMQTLLPTLLQTINFYLALSMALNNI